MLHKIKLPNLSGNAPERIQVWVFTLPDGTTTTKKLHQSIPATGDKPRINIFDDGCFTVGETPEMYKRASLNVEDPWILEFTFTNLSFIYATDHNDILEMVIKDKEKG